MNRFGRTVLLCVAAGWALWAASCGRGPQALYKDLHDPDPKVRTEAAVWLGQAKPAGAVDELVRVLDDPDEAVRVEAIRALGAIGDPKATPALLPLVGDRLDTVRLATARALGGLKDPAAVPAFERLLADTDETVRVTAILALAEVPGPEAVGLLLKSALQDEYERVRQFAVRMLASKRAQEAIPLVERAVQNESDLLRSTAAQVLGEFGDASSVPVLLRALDDPYFKVRSLSAHTLAKVAPSDPQAREAVIRRFAVEEEAMTRVDLAWALAGMGDRSGIPILRELLFKGQPQEVRAEAAKALGEVGEPSDRALLKRASRDKQGMVRDAVSKALDRLEAGPAAAPARQVPQVQPPG